MRLTRRAFLAGVAASAALPGPAKARPQAPSEPTSIVVTATPIESFSVAERERRNFGVLTFRSGLQLRSDFEGFGGFSGLWRSPGGEEIVALADNTQWLTARVVSTGGRMTGLIDAVLDEFNALWEGRQCATCRRKDHCPVPLEEPELA